MARDPVLKPSTLRGMRRWVLGAQKYAGLDDRARQELAVIQATVTWALREGKDPLVTVLRAANGRREESEKAAKARAEAVDGL